MNSQKIAEKFVRSFCNADLESLKSVLSHNFQLHGPLFEFTSAAGYLASLSGNLAADPDSVILASFGNGENAAVFYIYRGNTIGQLFVCREGRVNKTTLVFDTKSVA